MGYILLDLQSNRSLYFTQRKSKEHISNCVLNKLKGVNK